ncbi:MAG: UbiA family prenyltransferase [Saprospiraceae bacterium]|nr:UbiA family prenyltransferase [Saprospiraceae bacterium]
MNIIPYIRLVWVAACAVSLLAQTRCLLELPLMPGWIDGFVFGGTVFGYHCTHPDGRLRRIAWLFGLSGALSLLGYYFSAQSHTEAFVVIALSALCWLGYYGFQRPGNQGLRARPLAKPVVVAITWAFVTVLLPAPTSVWPMLGGVLLGRSGFVFALALAYDLHDLSYDQKHGLPTLAGRLGEKRTFSLIYAALFLSVIAVAFNLYLKVYSTGAALGLWLSLFACALLLPRFFQKKAFSPWRKTLIDALMPFQFLLVWLHTEAFCS